MRLSEAILLGSTIVHPRAGSLRFSRSGEGCALGMAAIATGCTFVKPLRQIPAKDLRTANIEVVFGAWLLRVVMRPCECQLPLPREMRIKDIIAHLFDIHVMQKKNWTLAQLAEWVERWEPAEYAPGSSAAADELARELLSAEELRSEAAEWQSSRDAFLAKHESRRRVRRIAIRDVE